MMRVDWKFIVTGILTAAVPLWIYYSDLASRSLRVEIIAKTALQPFEACPLPGLTVSFEGQELESPYLTVLQVSNDGGRPIPASAFENPVEIKAEDKVKIVRAEVTAVNPKDLRPQLELDSNVVKLHPLLLNPGDSIRVDFITSGRSPEFSPRARIEGITLSSIEDAGTKKTERRTWINAFLALALLIASTVNYLGFVKPDYPLRRRTMAFAGLSKVDPSVKTIMSRV